MGPPAAPRPVPSGSRQGVPISKLLTVRDETDIAGRLLLEDSAPKKARRTVERSGVAMKSVRCPYTDTPSRTGGLMNVSAYEALRHDTGPILDGFAWLAENYYGLHPDHRSTVQGLLDVSNLGLSLPLVLLHRAADPVPKYGGMPTFIASIFKAGRGVFAAAVDMLNRLGGPAPITAADIVKFADEHHHLMRPQTRRACAAPTRLIERTLAVIVTGEGGEAGRSTIGDLVRFADLWRFYTVQETFNEAVNKYRWFLQKAVEQAGTRDPDVLFNVRMQEGGRNYLFGELTAGFIDHANHLQGALNQSLGRLPDAPPLMFKDVMQLL